MSDHVSTDKQVSCENAIFNSTLYQELMILKQSILRTDSVDVPPSDDEGDSIKPHEKIETIMSEVELQKRKAHRRREQVRAASRRCRERQRQETKKLKSIVSRLDEFTTYTIIKYEREIDHLKLHLSGSAYQLMIDNENLRQRISHLESIAFKPQFYNGDDHQPPIQFNTEQSAYALDMVETATKKLLEICESVFTTPLVYASFGWQFVLWADDQHYYVKSHKFLPGIKAIEISNRVQNVDLTYQRTFQEVTNIEVLMRLSPFVQLIKWTKDFPGKGVSTNVNLEYLKKDEEFTGERWVTGAFSVDSLHLSDISYEEELNGYIFEDSVQFEDGRPVHGCIAMGVGRFEIDGGDKLKLMRDMANEMASVMVRWEGLFVNDYIKESEDDEPSKWIKEVNLAPLTQYIGSPSCKDIC